jgi:hypothetical protein
MRIKLIARVMAEGMRDIFSLLHATIRKHGQQLETVRLRNAWVNVDPRAWRTRDDMTINVALGSGGKAQQFAQTMAMATSRSSSSPPARPIWAATANSIIPRPS